MTGRNAVAIVSDANIFPGAVFLCDRLSALNHRGDTDVVLFSDSDADVRAAVEFGVRFIVRRIDAASLRRLADNGMRLATYFRLLLPELLGADYRRILYLDVDVYPESDKVFALFDLDMRGHAVAAVRGLLHAAGTQEARTVLRKGGNKYLNAGVLLIDNARSAETEMTSRALDTARTRPVPLGAHDQSILNYLLDGDWLELSPSFNMIVPVWKSSVRRAFEPVIVHFAGSGKPWEGPRFSIDHPAGRELETFVAGTPWREAVVGRVGASDLRTSIGHPLRRGRPGRGQRAVLGALDHLRNTVFADVEQGLTTRRPEYLSARFFEDADLG